MSGPTDSSTGTIRTEFRVRAATHRPWWWAKGDPLASEGMRAFVEKRDPVWVTEAG